MKTARKVLAAPLERGFMRNGFFAWPARQYVCPGYTKHGEPVACGVTFENVSGNAERCVACRAEYKREWHRLNNAKRRPRR